MSFTARKFQCNFKRKSEEYSPFDLMSSVRSNETNASLELVFYREYLMFIFYCSLSGMNAHNELDFFLLEILYIYFLYFLLLILCSFYYFFNDVNGRKNLIFFSGYDKF